MRKSIVLFIMLAAAIALIGGCQTKTIIVVVVPTETPTTAPTADTGLAQAGAQSASAPTSAPATAPTAVPPTAAPIQLEAITAPTPPQAPTATAAPAPSGDPAAIARKGLDAIKANSFKADIGGQGTVEYSPTGNYHFVSGGTDAIFIGKDTYIKSSGNWKKDDSGFGGLILVPVMIALGYTDKITDAQLLGTETVNGVETQVLSYHGQIESNGQLGDKVAYKMYLGIKDGLPVKIHIDDGKEPFDTTYKFDPSIKVTAPPLE